jgi:hypothetical protein
MALAMAQPCLMQPGLAQSADPPEPIPTPPIPAPPNLSPAPPITFGPDRRPARPAINIPDPPVLSPFVIPPPAAMTAADPSSQAPPRLADAPPPRVSPGGAASQIEERLFIVDPGTSQLGTAAEAKLSDIARSLTQNPAARLEVRVFSPARPNAESNAHRLSLARFLSVRDFLVKDGIDDNRIDGRALVSRPDDPNADRIELYIER